jgi:hypothetical protein
LEQIAQDMWTDIESSLLSLNPLPNASPLTQEQWSTLMTDLRSGQAHIIALLKVKTAFWKLLPWILVGLGHGDLSVARETARSAIKQFERDPRREAHHRLTWFWMRPGHLRNALEAFANGSMTVLEVSVVFARQVARLRFVIVVETTIEAKHARVSLARRAHYIGPVAVSLSNRLGMLESLRHKGVFEGFVWRLLSGAHGFSGAGCPLITPRGVCVLAKRQGVCFASGVFFWSASRNPHLPLNSEERWLSTGHLKIETLIHWFSQARHFRKAATALNVSRHPEIIQNPDFMKRGSVSKLHPLLTRIFYNCSFDNVYRSLKSEAHKDHLTKGLSFDDTFRARFR